MGYLGKVGEKTLYKFINKFHQSVDCFLSRMLNSIVCLKEKTFMISHHIYTEKQSSLAQCKKAASLLTDLRVESSNPSSRGVGYN